MHAKALQELLKALEMVGKDEYKEHSEDLAEDKDKFAIAQKLPEGMGAKPMNKVVMKDGEKADMSGMAMNESEDEDEEGEEDEPKDDALMLDLLESLTPKKRSPIKAARMG
jgi:hypothetical protein